MSESIYDAEPDKIRELLIGRSVTKVDDCTLTLDDGTSVVVHGNAGCGGCGSGWYEVEALRDCPNVITNVAFEDSDAEPYGERLSIFVYAEYQKINLLSVSGSEGNGYYGRGYRLDVERPSQPKRGTNA